MSNKPIRSVIIEDEEESLQLLSTLILSSGLSIVVGSTADPEEATNLILDCNPDIVFLDIKLPGKTGFDILDDFRKLRSVNPYLVFTTAYDEFAVRAFEYAAFDYLLKPIDPQRLFATFMRYLDGMKSGNKQQTICC